MVWPDPIEYEHFSNRSRRLIDGSQTGVTISSQDGHESNDNEEVLHIPQFPRNMPCPRHLLNGAYSF